MSNALGAPVHKHQSRLIPAFSRVLRDQLIRQLKIVICCPETHSLAKKANAKISRAQALERSGCGFAALGDFRAMAGRRLQATPELAVQRSVPFFEPFCLLRKKFVRRIEDLDRL